MVSKSLLKMVHLGEFLKEKLKLVVKQYYQLKVRHFR